MIANTVLPHEIVTVYLESSDCSANGYEAPEGECLYDADDYEFYSFTYDCS